MQTSDISSAIQTTPPAPSSKDASATSSSDFKTFLTLLTAQMRNQDPLKPMESTEFVAQLASFSAVEQQIETNSKLNELLGLVSDNPSANLSDWLGKEVRREGIASFNGEPIEVAISTNPDADTAQLVVRDEAAKIVHTQQIAPDSDMAIWDGSTQSSEFAPVGRYNFEVESYSDGSLIESRAGSVFDLVTEVRLEKGNSILVFEDGATLSSTEATALRMSRS